MCLYPCVSCARPDPPSCASALRHYVQVPFCPMVGSEVYSSEVKKTEVLMENFRCVRLRAGGG